MNYEVGSIVAHYKILSRIGQGGMGVVYSAEDLKLKRSVALKFLSAAALVGNEDRARFQREAMVAAALNHPNICTIHGIEEWEGELFIVIEYVDGKTLRQAMPLPSIRTTFDAAIQIARGVSVAHENGVVHRDLKPENIMIRKDGRVVVMDFGLAKLRGGIHLTTDGTRLGTAAYMSPEQALGEEVDHRSDIFSLGIILYELFTGRPPFRGEHDAALVYEIVNQDPPPPSLIRPELHPDLDGIILDCLAKSPDDRCQSAAEVRRKLEAIAGSARTSTQKTARQVEITTKRVPGAPKLSRNARRAWIVATAVLAAGVGILCWMLLSTPRAIDLSRYRYTPFATDVEEETDGHWSPDGRSVVYLKRIDGFNQVMVKGYGRLLSTQLTFDSANVSNPFWSPDGNLIFYISGYNLFSLGPTGGEPKKILGGVQLAAISPDGSAIVSRRTARDSTSGELRTALWVSDPSGSHLRRLNTPVGTPPTFPGDLGFSPDGTKIGLAQYGNLADIQFWIIPWPDVPGAVPYRVFEGYTFSLPPAFSWLPDSRHMVLTNYGDLWLGNVQDGEMTCFVSSIGREEVSSVSPDGTKMLFSEVVEDYNIVRVPIDGAYPVPFIATSQWEFSPSISRATGKIAYTTDRGGEHQIWLRNAEGDIRQIVTAEDFPGDTTRGYQAVTISPTGTRIVFTRVGSAGIRTWVTNAEGGKPAPLSGDENITSPCWSPDGTMLAVLAGKDTLGVCTVRIGALDSLRTVRRGIGPGSSPQWSPDGRWIACGITRGILIISPDGRQERVIPSPVPPRVEGFLLVWSNDSRTIFVASTLDKGSTLHAVDIATGRSRLVANYGPGVRFGKQYWRGLFGSMMPDGKSFLTSIIESRSDIWILEGFPVR